MTTASVLLCDDAPEIREFLRTEVSTHPDMEVIGEASNGAEAVRMVTELQPDLVVLDLSMPLMDGIQALPLLWEAAPQTKVVVLSGTATDDIVADLLARGVAAFVEKGTPLKEIVRRVRQVCGLPESVSDKSLSRHQERKLFALSVDLLCVARPDGYFEHLSPSWERSLGWSIEELKARPFLSLIHPDDREPTIDRIQAMKDGAPLTKEFQNRYLCRDGSYSWLAWRSVIERDGFVYASARDVTEEKEAKRKATFLATIVDSSFDAVFSLDLGRTITSWNPAAEVIYGWTAEEAIGCDISLINPNNTEIEAFMGRARNNEVSRMESVRITKSGRPVDVLVTISPIFGETGEVIGVSSISMDISDRKKADAMRQEYQAELERRVSERTRELEQRTVELEESMAELDSFAYTVSHDLRAPLRALDGFSRIVVQELEGIVNDDQRRYLGFIRKNAQGMQQLVDGLLAFARLGRQALDLRPLAPAVLVRQALSDLGDLAERPGIQITIGDLPDCVADPMLLKQVYVNLIGNALKFTSRERVAHIHIGSEVRDDSLVYFVRDNGVGFDPRFADKIFGVFQRMHRQEDYEGTGIGLANVQRIVERHGGVVGCEAAVNEGATFSFTLPLGGAR